MTYSTYTMVVWRPNRGSRRSNSRNAYPRWGAL